MHYNHAHKHPSGSSLPCGPARLWGNSVSVWQTGRLGEAGLYLLWLGFCLLVERRTKKPKCQGQASSTALSNNPLTASWPIHKERGVFSCLWGRRWKERGEGGGREQTDRQWKETAILSRLLSVTVHNRQREEEFLMLTKMPVCVCVRAAWWQHSWWYWQWFYNYESSEYAACVNDDSHDYFH